MKPLRPAHNVRHADTASSRSIFLPISGYALEKRSPPLSLVKTTIVFSRTPISSIAAKTRPMPSSLIRIISKYVFTEPPSR